MKSELCKVFEKWERNDDYLNAVINAGIEKNRKGDVTLYLTDASNQPLSGVKIRAKQIRHQFKHGANCFMLDEMPTPEDNKYYEETFAKVFNLATLPFYWNTLELEQGKPRYKKDSPYIYRRPTPDRCLEFCSEYGIHPKAHCLNYPCIKTLDWMNSDLQTEKMLLTKHFKELGELYADKIQDWEVTNETFWCYHNEEKHLPSIYYARDLIEWSFNAARHFFPGNNLIINDNYIWNNHEFFHDRSPYFMQIERALLKGAPIDTIGMQFHLFCKREHFLNYTQQSCDPMRHLDVMDCYAMLGKPLQITEITFPAYSPEACDEEFQAEMVRRFYPLWFSHKAMNGIIYWNLIDGYAVGAEKGDFSKGENYYRGGLLRYDLSKKPAYDMIDELFNHRWRTEAIIETDEKGKAILRGFYGDYELTIEGNGVTKKQVFRLSENPIQTKEICIN